MPYSTFPLRKNERTFLQIQHFMSEYSASIHISWGNPLRFLYPIEKAQLLQAALDHSLFRFHAYFFLCSITPASNARSICASSCASPSNAVCCGSPSRILSVLRISLGITTRPNSSILRTMPVARTIMLPPSSTFALFGTPIMRQATRFMRMSPSGNPIQRIVQAARPRSMILAEKTLSR